MKILVTGGSSTIGGYVLRDRSKAAGAYTSWLR